MLRKVTPDPLISVTATDPTNAFEGFQQLFGSHSTMFSIMNCCATITYHYLRVLDPNQDVRAICASSHRDQNNNIALYRRYIVQPVPDYSDFFVVM